MIVVLLRGTSTRATGRDIAMIKLVNPSKKRANGTCRRQFECLGIASRIRDRLEYRTAKRRLRLNIQI